MPIISPNRSLEFMRKTPGIVKATLGEVSQERARTATDGPNGWSVLEVICHLRDWEDIFCERVQMMLSEDNPKLPDHDQEQMAKDRHYSSQDLQQAFDLYLNLRQRHLQILAGLTPEQWQRRGLHPRWGEINVVEHGMNTALHDVNHIEQMVRALGLAGAMV